MMVHAQGKAQNRPDKTLKLHIRLILVKKTVYNNKNKNQSTRILETANPGEGRESEFQSYYII